MATATLNVSSSAAPRANTTGLVGQLVDWLVRMGEMSPGARAARAYAALNALSDAELAKRGLNRADLLDHCFGPFRRG